MPIFEYHCLICRNDFELLIYTNSKDPSCPECGTAELRRKFSVFGMRSGERFVPSAGASCGGCASHNCSDCSH